MQRSIWTDGVIWRRLSLNMLAAFLAGDGVLVCLMPARQTGLWSPNWSPAAWREALRFLERHPRLSRALALLEAGAGIALAARTNSASVDR